MLRFLRRKYQRAALLRAKFYAVFTRLSLSSKYSVVVWSFQCYEYSSLFSTNAVR